jgi:hypothetical protein
MPNTLSLKLFFLLLTHAIHILLTQDIDHFDKFLCKAVTVDLITFFGIVADINKKLMWFEDLHLTTVAGIK